MARKDGEMPNDDLAMAGSKLGEMSPKLKDFQRPMKDFSQDGYNRTLEYVERQNRIQGVEATKIEKQAYKGRYS